jgi:hypothetical protein
MSSLFKKPLVKNEFFDIQNFDPLNSMWWGLISKL